MLRPWWQCRRNRQSRFTAALIGPAAFAVTAALAVAGAVAFPGGAQAASAGAIIGAGSGRCVDVPGVVTTNRTQVELWDCNGGTNQMWALTSTNALQVYGSKCLEVNGGATADGTKVQIDNCTGGTNQQWTFNTNGTVTDRNSGKCLDANAMGTANGTLLQIWSCNGGSNQSWSALSGTSTAPVSTPPTTNAPPSTTNLPCDLYASGGTPCVAAHSTVRALFRSYSGHLYQVKRSKDNATLDIGVLSPGGYANAAAQDSFCAGTTCHITVIYDQSGRGNNLTQAPPGGFAGPAAGGYDNLANATAAQTTVNGHKAYGVFVAPGTGYRNNKTSGIAKGDQPEGMYAILDGTHYNKSCCFDYGNAETNSRDNGNGTMEAIYFGNSKTWGSGAGNGPWVMADLENGLFSGVNKKSNANDPSISHRYLTAIIKGRQNQWAIRAGNAQSGNLSTFYNGVRPNASGYNPMKKEGAIILGIGGDNSNSAAGTFYEGAMTSGYPSDATENAVQANITTVNYH